MEKDSMEEQEWQGKCYLCGTLFSKKEMKKHLRLCREKQDAGIPEGDRKPTRAKSFILLVEGRHYPEYWLYLEVPVRTKLEKLDGFSGISGWSAAGT